MNTEFGARIVFAAYLIVVVGSLLCCIVIGWRVSGMRKFLCGNGLSLGFGLLFLLALVGQALAGHADLNDRLLADGGDPISLGALFLLSWFAQSVAGHSTYNNQRLVDFQDVVTYGDYLVSPDLWNRSLRNWQSEFLAIGSTAALSVFLRQRGSPESKPVGAAHATTGETG